MRRIWKRIGILGGLVLGAALMITPASVQAKKTADKGIALTAKNFPDKNFLNQAKTYDKDKNGYLSKAEIAAVKELAWDMSLSDFSQLSFFTNVRSLYLSGFDYGLWLGEELDLTCFPKLESASIYLNTKSVHADAEVVRVKVNGLKKLKKLSILDDASADLENPDSKYDGSDINMDVIDFRNTPALEEVAVGGAKGIIFDDAAKIRELSLYSLSEVPREQIESFARLKKLTICANISGFTQLDLSGMKRLTQLSLEGDYLRTVELGGAAALKELRVESSALETIDVSRQANLEELSLNCPALKELNVQKNPVLWRLSVTSEQMTQLDVTKNPALRQLQAAAWKLAALDISQNAAVEYLNIESDRLMSLHTGNNKKLKELRVSSKELSELDLRKNKKLNTLYVSGEKLGALDLSANTRLWRLRILNAPIASLDLSTLEKLQTLIIIGDKQLAKLDVSANENLNNLILEDTAIASLDLLGQKELRQVSISRNQKLSELKLTSGAVLSELTVKETALKTLAVPKQKILWKLEVSGNPSLERLDLSKLPKLSTVKITENGRLRELDFTNNEKLTQVNINGNALMTLNFGKLPTLCYLNCRNNQLSGIDLSGSEWGTLKVYCDEGVDVTGCAGTVYTDEPQEGSR